MELTDTVIEAIEILFAEENVNSWEYNVDGNKGYIHSLINLVVIKNEEDGGYLFLYPMIDCEDRPLRIKHNLIFRPTDDEVYSVINEGYQRIGDWLGSENRQLEDFERLVEDL